MHRSGFAALVGRPNVGKSTLVNAFLGEKVAIISDKPQTTRNRIRAVLTREESQIIFIDTPGLHKPRHKLGAAMVRAAARTIHEVDLICFVAEGHKEPGTGDRHIVSMFKKGAAPVLLVLNKTDLAPPDLVSRHAHLYEELYPFAAAFSVSALQGARLEPLIDYISGRLPEGPRYYPPDMKTDQPETFITAEIIREKLIRLTRDEIPFSLAVSVEEMSMRKDKDLLDIRAEVYVERESQSGIVIGKKGSVLKEAGTEARRELEFLFGHKVFLDIRVKVKKGWRNRDGSLQTLGYGSL